MGMSIEELPHYLECPNCELPHFLSINRDLYGKWTAGYVAFGEEGESLIEHLFINSADSLKEIALRLEAKLKRYNG